MFELRQSDKEKAAVETTGNYKPSSSNVNLQATGPKYFNFWLQGNHAPHGPNNFVCTRSEVLQPAGSTEHKKGLFKLSYDYSVVALENLQINEYMAIIH